MILGRTQVINGPNTAVRAAMTITKEACFVIIDEVENHGTFTLDGSDDKTSALILSPKVGDVGAIELKG